MSSSSSSDDVDERLDDIIDQIVEETHNDIVEPQPNNRRRRAYVERYREGGHNRLWNDYFSVDATYSAQFRRRFRMNKDLFMRIVYELSENIPFFQHRQDATGRFGHTPVQKCTAAIRQLAYGSATDAVDEYLRIGESTALLCLHMFTDGIIRLFGDEYLRRPTPADLRRLLDIGETRGVKNVVNGHPYKLAYYLTDGIYPEWSTFIQSITLPQTPKQELFAKVQEATRKDVERAFGVLQARFAIVKNPALSMNKTKIGKIMRASNDPCACPVDILGSTHKDHY
ncbi:uncharacterized protein LOC125579936 [Brassica napus]|uniref:uncharacterized protein LOC125579936 n=1 Tax=Brassica napus TaxID=3708 RepID=UPI002078C855|nr:uncharacterized protein LOC125579936 [Brassica napus]